MPVLSLPIPSLIASNSISYRQQFFHPSKALSLIEIKAGHPEVSQITLSN